MLLVWVPPEVKGLRYRSSRYRKHGEGWKRDGEGDLRVGDPWAPPGGPHGTHLRVGAVRPEGAGGGPLALVSPWPRSRPGVLASRHVCCPHSGQVPPWARGHLQAEGAGAQAGGGQKSWADTAGTSGLGDMQALEASAAVIEKPTPLLTSIP